MIEHEELVPTVGNSTGNAERYVQVVNNVAKVELDVNAFASSTGVNAGAMASARGASIQVAERAVTIQSSVDMTAHKGSSGGAVPNIVYDFADVVGDTVSSVYGSAAGPLWGAVNYRYSRGLWGSWSAPYNEWWFHRANNYVNEPDYRSDTAWTEIEWVDEDLYFSSSDIEDMVKNGPKSFRTTVRVTNDGGSGTMKEANFTMRVHSPVEKPILQSDEIRWGAWYPVSPIATLHPNDGDVTQSYSVTLTQSVTVTASLSGTPLSLLGAGLDVQFGGTAAISNRQTRVWTFSADPDSRDLPVHWEVVRATVWKEFSGVYDKFDQHGFDGVTHFVGTKWRSATKLLAEQNDYDEQTNYWYDS